MKELHASCLCGAVALTLPDQFDYMGNCHCSECRKFSGGDYASVGGLDGNKVTIVKGIDAISRYRKSAETTLAFCRHCGSSLFSQQHNPTFDKGPLNLKMVEDLLDAVENMSGGEFRYDIRNTDRSVGARLSGEIVKRHGNQGMAADPVKVHFNGTAGQSFGVWNAGGLEMILTGDANDYVGKGMTGGKLVIKPHVGVAFKSHEAAIIGNTCLYGATGGKLYAAGTAGERFAVRNSGALAVVEGIGDNGCEYMTGGIVTVLGKTGVNFAAGMTGGFAYVLDECGNFAKRTNPELVELLDVADLAIHQEHLRGIITAHLNETGSSRAEEILANFDSYVPKFRLIKPKSSDVKSLLGHTSRSSAELRIQAQ